MTLAVWILAAGLLALWTLGAWGLHSLLTMEPAWLAGWPERFGDWLASQPWADRVDLVWPGWQSMLRLAADLTQGLLGWLGDGALWILWILWGLGALALLVGAAIVAWLIGYARRHATPPSAIERAAV